MTCIRTDVQFDERVLKHNEGGYRTSFFSQDWDNYTTVLQGLCGGDEGFGWQDSYY